MLRKRIQYTPEPQLIHKVKKQVLLLRSHPFRHWLVLVILKTAFSLSHSLDCLETQIKQPMIPTTSAKLGVLLCHASCHASVQSLHQDAAVFPTLPCHTNPYKFTALHSAPLAKNPTAFALTTRPETHSIFTFASPLTLTLTFPLHSATIASACSIGFSNLLLASGSIGIGHLKGIGQHRHRAASWKGPILDVCGIVLALAIIPSDIIGQSVALVRVLAIRALVPVHKDVFTTIVLLNEAKAQITIEELADTSLAHGFKNFDVWDGK
jgi:hypothetical protein